MIDKSMAAQLGGETGVLARTMYGEDRGDGAAGMDAVGCVVRNRVNIAKAYVAKHGEPHPLFGDGSYASACLTPFQFSCWLRNDPNRPKIVTVTPESDPLFAEALELAGEIIAGQIADQTNSATHYKETSIPWPRAWGAMQPAVAVIGRQTYYRLT